MKLSIFIIFSQLCITNVYYECVFIDIGYWLSCIQEAAGKLKV